MNKIKLTIAALCSVITLQSASAKDITDEMLLNAANLLGVEETVVQKPLIKVKHVPAYRRNPALLRTGGQVWRQVYHGFRIRAHHHRPEVQRFVKTFARNPNRTSRIAARSSQYLPIVVDELRRRRMPTELALLPFVESAYNNRAYSHAGAAGMWQFISSTGRIFGLKQTRSFDERMDPIASTRAALDYLQKLHREFRGDWLLALAAYNCGEGRVRREVAYNRAKGRPTDYWNLDLPRETREYVPRLLAYKEIVRNPRRFGVDLTPVGRHNGVVMIRVNKAVDLKKVALTAGLPKNSLTGINSSFLHGITTPKYSDRILLPRQHAGVLNRIIQKMPAARDVHHVSAPRFRSKKRRSKYHKVRKGDTLYSIARRYGVSVKRLKRANRMRNSRIRIGKRLVLPKRTRRRST